MMYGDPQQQQHQQQQHHQQPPGGGGDHFHRGPPLQQPPGPPMMRQPSASSTTLNPSGYHHPSANPPYDAHGNSFTAKRMRNLTQRRAVDYTSTVVRYMQQSAKVLTLETHTVNEDWTIVLPRRGRKGRNLPRIRTPEEQQKPWFPTEPVSDPHRESKLLQKMQTCIKKLESSEFYQTFMNQIQTPEILNRFYSVLGSELKMQMVIYGIGSIESYETPRLQLSLAILMKRKLNWIGDVEVFDPILSATESRVLESCGCSVLSVNEQGRRCAIKPTLFYMPHCEAELYDNLLQANQGVTLKGIVLLGNSFETYEQHVSEYKSSVIVDTARHALAVRKFTQEFSIKTISDDYFAAFHDSSWHFFSPDVEAELQLTEI